MPELPEVETLTRDLRRAGLVGRRIRCVRLRCPGLIAGCPPRAFAARLKNRTVLSVGRRGKFIVLRLSGGVTLLIHLRMTGQFVLADPAAPFERHEHLALALNDGRELRYRDVRRFGRWRLTTDPDSVLRRLGPEPLSRAFRLPEFAARLARRRRMLKPLLLDQSFLAGLGNIYADESLWEARLHPQRRADTLKSSESERLFQAIRKSLRRGIHDLGTSLGLGQTHFAGLDGRRGAHQQRLNAYQCTGEPCPRCGATIRRIIVGQRSTHLCPACQRRRSAG